MYQKIILLLFVFFTVLACDNTEPVTGDPAASTNTPAPSQTGMTLPPIPPDEGRYLMENVSYIDMTFNNLPFSMSVDNKPGIQTSLNMIDATSPPQTLKSTCSSMGKIFYDINGQTVLTAEIMYGDGCNYYVFYKNNQPVYANRMTAEAVNYFTNVITNVKVQ